MLPSRFAAFPRTTLCLAAAVLAARAHAQDCSTLDFTGGNVACLPHAGGTYGEMIAGDLSGDQIPEVALLAGSELIVVHGAAIGNDSVIVATDAHAVCYAPDAAGPGAPGLFYSSPEGIHRVVFEQDHYTVSGPLVAGAWEGAVELHHDPVDGFLGVDGTGYVALRSSLDGGAVGPPEVLFTLTSQVRDMRLVDWDGLGTALVLRQTNGLQVRRQGGGVLFSRVAAIPDDPESCIAVAAREGDVDTVAWVTRASSAQGPVSYLLLLSSRYGTPYYRGPYLLSEGPYDSASAGDLDGDGNAEVVLSHHSSGWVGATDVDALETLPPPTDAPLEIFELCDIGTSVSGNGAVLCADLFNDRYAQDGSPERPLSAVALALGDHRALRMLPSRTGKTYCEHCLYRPGDFEGVQSTLGGECTGGTTGNARTWTISLGTGWGDIEADHVEITVRRSLEGQATDSVPISHYFAPVPEDGSIADVDLVFTSDDPPTTSYFALVRPVRLEGTEQVWRSSILSMSASCSSNAWLKDLFGAFEDYHCIAFPCEETFDPGCIGCPQPTAGGRVVPSAVPQSRIPSTGPGILPENPPN